MKRILIFAGTRPEAVKTAPVMRVLKDTPGVEAILVSSGQHKEMLCQAFADFGLRPDCDLEVMAPGQTLASLTAKLFAAADGLLTALKPDCVLVQGDTSTVFAVSVCAFYLGIPVGHIEAGLRSFRLDAPFPEEFNRRAAGIVARWHFAPTETARDNLLREHTPVSSIHVTGNTVIDALLWMKNQGGAGPQLLPPQVRRALDTGRRLILVTGHRRENFGQGLAELCRALRELAEAYPDVAFVYPVHLNPQVRGPIFEALNKNPGVLLLDPLPYKPFISLLDAAHIVLTDSGGVQEEGPALGKPVLVMREVTERPEGVAAGTARLVGADARNIIKETARLLDDKEAYTAMARAVNPYGDGLAAIRIKDALLRELP